MPDLEISQTEKLLTRSLNTIGCIFTKTRSTVTMRQLLLVTMLGLLAVRAPAQPNESARKSDFDTRIFYGGLRFKELVEKGQDLKNLISKYERNKQDTTAVLLLLQIDHFYLARLSLNNHNLDSALLLSKQAAELARSLQYKTGLNEAVCMMASAYILKKDFRSAIALMNTTEGEVKVRILVRLGEEYLFRLGELPANLDTCYTFIQAAIDVSNKLKNSSPRFSTLRLMGKYYFARGNISKGKDSFMKIIDELHIAQDTLAEAFWWNELGLYTPDNDSTYQDRIHSLEQALALYRATKFNSEQAEILKDIAEVYEVHGRYNLAERYALDALNIKKSFGTKKLYTFYHRLAIIYTELGNYEKALYYEIATQKNAELFGEVNMEGIIWFQLGQIYQLVGETAKSMQFYKLAMDKLIDKRDMYIYFAAAEVVKGFLKQKKEQEALDFLTEFLKTNNPVRLSNKEIVASAKGDCYAALGKYAKAENEYLKMIELDKEMFRHSGRQMYSLENALVGAAAYFKIGHFYYQTGRFSAARPYLEQALNFKKYSASRSQQKDIHYILFQVDSAEAKYNSAIKHFRIHKSLNDSIFNARKSKQIAELQIKYDTDKKELELEAFRSRERLQMQRLGRATTVRNFTYVLVAVLVGFLGLGYSRYRLKQKSNKQLQAQQNEINLKNIALQQLVNEKEWLVKEIHHRVKNNFQVVVGLLETQAGYLKNGDTLRAMQDSRHRIQAMAMIHQKLYQTENMSAINVADYVYELVDYLRSSFETKMISFIVEVEPITLSVSESLPIGLILNEVITNSIKYAFGKEAEGTITVSLRRASHHELVLSIADNGVGLPPGFNFKKSNSMGINLLKGLVEDIDGNFVVENYNGVRYEITFHHECEMAD